MSGFFGGGQQAKKTTETQQVLSPEQRELMALAMPGVRNWAAKVPQRYQGSQIAGFTNPQQQGQEMALAAAGGQQQLAQGAAGAANFWTGDNIWDPANNPALSGAIDRAVRPVTERFQETILPGIQDNAIQAGQQFGGSRRGVAEGMASRDYMRQVGDTAAGVVNDNYKTNVGAQLQAAGLTNQLQNAQVAPANTTSGVGDIQQQMQQSLLGQDVGNFNWEQNAPFMQSKELMSLLQGLPGGGTTSTATANQPQANPAMQMLGLGMQALPFLMS